MYFTFTLPSLFKRFHHLSHYSTIVSALKYCVPKWYQQIYQGTCIYGPYFSNTYLGNRMTTWIPKSWILCQHIGWLVLTLQLGSGSVPPLFLSNVLVVHTHVLVCVLPFHPSVSRLQYNMGAGLVKCVQWRWVELQGHDDFFQDCPHIIHAHFLLCVPPLLLCIIAAWQVALPHSQPLSN